MKRLSMIIMMVLCFMAQSFAQPISIDTIDSQKLLARAYHLRYGINTDVEVEKAAKIYNFLAAKGNIIAQRELGRMFLNGEGVKRNYKYALFLLKKACLAGDSKAMCTVARMYLDGLGVRSNNKTALYFYRKAASYGNAQGYYGVGSMLYKGLGVKQDYAKAKEWLSVGSNKGSARCDFLLANYYAYGFGKKPDYPKAKEFLDKAVKNGHGWTVDMTLHSKLDSVIKQNLAKQSLLKKSKAVTQSKPKTKAYSYGDIVGLWKGRVFTYDWSKTRIMKEETMAIRVEYDTCLVVTCLRGDSTLSIFRSDEQKGNKWFKHRIRKEDYGFKWIPLSIDFEVSEDHAQLYANLTRLNANSRNRLKPMTLDMSRCDAITGIEKIQMDNQNIVISPQPLQDDFKVTISINTTTNVHISLYSLNGMKVSDCGTFTLQAGINQIPIHTKLTSGEYILLVEGNGIKESKKIVHL